MGIAVATIVWSRAAMKRESCVVTNVSGRSVSEGSTPTDIYGGHHGDQPGLASHVGTAFRFRWLSDCEWYLRPILKFMFAILHVVRNVVPPYVYARHAEAVCFLLACAMSPINDHMKMSLCPSSEACSARQDF